MKKTLILSVHDIVDIILRRGNLDTRIFNQSSMTEGTRLHGVFQKQQGETYISEYPLRLLISLKEYNLEISGRADGIIKVDDAFIIDEIKTTVDDLEVFHVQNKDWHQGQAMFYAYMLAQEKTLSRVFVRLTYIHQLKEQENKVYESVHTFGELEDYVLDIARQYIVFVSNIEERRERRNETIKKMTFPYDEMRNGQDRLIEFASEIAHNNEKGYVEAPTGIGKTVSVLYPFIKELEKTEKEKIFYLTSKNSIKEAVYKLLFHMNEKGLKLTSIFLTSKETLCLNEKKRHCNPDECPFARRYYDKVNRVIFTELNSRNVFTQGDIISIAHKYEICPFELQLDLSLYVDVIVGDYNYVYDPSVRLLRYFETTGQRPYMLLVDEAHNLPSRTRDMYSQEVTIFDFIHLMKEMPKTRENKFNRVVQNIIKHFEEIAVDSTLRKRTSEVPYEILDLFLDFIDRTKTMMKDHHEDVNDTILEIYFKVNSFLNLPPDDTEHFAYYYIGYNNKAVGFRITCVDSRNFITNSTKIFMSSLFFSATLSPHNYYIDLLGGKEESKTLFLPSPFEFKNRCVIIDSEISTFYRDRDRFMPQVADLIVKIVKQKVGNYFVFFPSYEYMEKCYAYFDNTTSIDVLTQDRNMDNYERSDFLARFKKNPTRTTVGFIIMGGIFSEGIDLLSDRLIGAIIVGVGLPKVSFENDLIKEHEGEKNPNIGFEYAYVYPGFNKVLQAAGRVIRSEEDRGVIVLADSRFASMRYMNLYQEIWPDAKQVSSDFELESIISEFWEECE